MRQVPKTVRADRLFNRVNARLWFSQEPFFNPFYDQSDKKIGGRELDVIAAMANGAQISMSRVYVEEIKCYTHYWTWSHYPNYPVVFGWLVESLMARGIIRSVRCGGGYTKLVFTPRAEQTLESCWKIKLRGRWVRVKPNRKGARR